MNYPVLIGDIDGTFMIKNWSCTCSKKGVVSFSARGTFCVKDDHGYLFSGRYEYSNGHKAFTITSAVMRTGVPDDMRQTIAKTFKEHVGKAFKDVLRMGVMKGLE